MKKDKYEESRKEFERWLDDMNKPIMGTYSDGTRVIVDGFGRRI